MAVRQWKTVQQEGPQQCLLLLPWQAPASLSFPPGRGAMCPLPQRPCARGDPNTARPPVALSPSESDKRLPLASPRPPTLAHNQQLGRAYPLALHYTTLHPGRGTAAAALSRCAASARSAAMR